jgi:twinkle protein
VHIPTDDDLRATARKGKTEWRTLCPACAADRHSTRRSEPTLSCRYTTEPNGHGSAPRIITNCWHCGKGDVILIDAKDTPVARPLPVPVPARVFPPPRRKAEDLYSQHLAYLRDTRKLSLETVLAAGLYSDLHWMLEDSGSIDVIAFPYIDATDTVRAIKYRTLTKHFSAEAGGQWGLYGMWQQFDFSKPLVIVEGEFDALALMEAGVPNGVSVPSGAGGSGQARFRWMEDETWLRQFATYVLAVDTDTAGQELFSELGRRLGIARCLQTEFPEGCKDSNSVLVQHGAQALAAAIERAVPVPLEGVYDVDHYWEGLLAEYDKGLGRGYSTGYTGLDSLYTVEPGELTVVTGIPSHGKSQFLDQLMVNLAEEHDWRLGVCSFENSQKWQIARLVGMHMRRPVKRLQPDRMSKEEFSQGHDWVQSHFVFMDYRKGSSPTIQSIMERAESMLLRYGIKGLVIDPYTYIERPKSTGDHGEIEFIVDMLRTLSTWAHTNLVHLWLVAHPTKMKRWEGQANPPSPEGYDICGSAAFYNWADCGLTVYRPAGDVPLADIKLWKVRHDNIGHPGKCEFVFDQAIGTYREASLEPPSYYGNQAQAYGD